MLNERQKKLYQFLIDKVTTNQFISKEEICYSLQELYPRHLEKSNDHNSVAYCNIKKDVRAINSSDAEHIIVSNHTGWKIGNKEETKFFLDSRFKRDFRSLKRNWNIVHKVGLDGQIKFGNELKEIKTFIERT